MASERLQRGLDFWKGDVVCSALEESRRRVGIETALSLRKGRVVPRRMRRNRGKMLKTSGNIDSFVSATSERRYGRRAGSIGLLSLGTILFLSSFSAESEPLPQAFVKGSVEQAGETTHLEFQGRAQWDYEVLRTPSGELHLILPPLDSVTEIALKTMKSSLVQAVTINKAADQKIEVVFKLADAKVESFDYLTDDPSRLILDFYRQNHIEKKTGTPAETAQKTNAKPKLPRQAKAYKPGEYKPVEKGQRQPAGSELLEVTRQQGSMKSEDPDVFSPFQVGSFDGNDPQFERFLMRDYQIREEAIIAGRQNIYIPFPMLKMETSRLAELEANPPEYEIKDKAAKETKEARLILALARNGRIGLMIKAANYFLKKYPESVYGEIVHHVLAEGHFALYRKDESHADLEEARKIYHYLLHKYPQSPLTERTELFLAYLDLEEKNALETIQSFSRFIQRHPRSPFVDGAKKALADGYLILSKFSDALKVYEDIRDHSTSPVESIEAQFRMGDVYFSEKQYRKAAEAYADVIKKHPGYDAKFPNAYYNMAEAQFWLGQYKESLSNYVAYLKNFPSGSHGGYAMTRVGEVLELLGADQKQVMGAFLESHFRYRGNPGADVALVRMTAQRMKGMKDKELRRSIEEIDHIAEHSTLPDMKQFVTIVKADGFRRRGDYATAMRDLISYYQANPTTTSLDVFKKRILGNMANIIRDYVEKGQFLETLKFNGKFANTWLRNLPRMDIPYFLGRAYEQAGVFAEAEKIFQNTNKELRRIAGTQEEKERRVLEMLPSQETALLRLASVKVAERQWGEAEDLLKQIKNVNALKEEERVERVERLAEISEARGDYSRAEQNLSILVSEWKGQPEILMPAVQRLGEIRMEQKNYEGAMKAFEQIVAAKKQNVPVADDVWARTLRARGDVLLAQGQGLAAADTYQQLLDQYEQKRPLGAVRYQVGQIFFSKGDLQNAAKVWSRLDGSNNQVYKKLAQEKLVNAQWQDEYKRYIQRIPAMTEVQ